MEKVLLIIPAYNEEENILKTYQKVIDYNKKEKTYKKIVELKGNYIDSKDNNIGCSNCWYKENKMKSTEEYVEELGKVIKRFENEQK